MNIRDSARAMAVQLTLLCVALGGCTSVAVKPVSADNRIEHICIQDNPRVQVGDFVAVMQEGFQNHGITSQVFKDTAPARCLFTSTYTAQRTWDMAMYMTDARVDILRDGRSIASAVYHLKGGGGLSLNKWANTRTKMLPVIDALLAQVTPSGRLVSEAAGAPPPVVDTASAERRISGQLAQKLSELKDAFDARLITQEEYEAKRKALIAEL
jgi:hypothetical protein